MSSKLKQQDELAPQTVVDLDLSPIIAWQLSEIKDWKKFGKKLRVPKQVLQDIEKKHPKNVQRALEEVIRYGTGLYKDAITNKIIEILFEMGEKELAMKLLADKEPYVIIPSRPDELVVRKEDDIIKSLKYLQEEFAYLVNELQSALQEVADFVNLKRFIKEYLRESFSPKEDPASIDSLFDALRKHYCYLNFEILEVIAKGFAYQYANRLMYNVITDYKTDLNEFLESTHLKAFKDAVEKIAQEAEVYQLTPGQCNVVLRLEGSWMKARVSCLWVLLKHIFRDKVSLFTRLKIEGGSVIVRFVVPSSIMVALISLA
uniref:Death domain-containing protein n=1 Tax=Amphimedon queenslandica TaxID=400682 RepID=A0A1X7SGR1_AMPQE